VNPETLVRTVEDFLVGARNAVVMEDGAVAFDLAQSKYSISGERNKCVLHLWSSERNVVRRVIEAEVKNEVLRLEVQRLGQAHPSKLEICRERDRRTPTAKRAARLTYARVLQRVLEKNLRGIPWRSSPLQWIWSVPLVHLYTGTFTTGPVCHCRAGRELRGDPGFH